MNCSHFQYTITFTWKKRSRMIGEPEVKTSKNRIFQHASSISLLNNAQTLYERTFFICVSRREWTMQNIYHQYESSAHFISAPVPSTMTNKLNNHIAECKTICWFPLCHFQHWMRSVIILYFRSLYREWLNIFCV